MKLQIGKQSDNDGDSDIRKVIREELQAILPDIIIGVTSEVYKELPPSIIDYHNKQEASKVHREESSRDFEKEMEGHVNRLKEHQAKYPQRLTFDKPNRNRGMTVNLQMAERKDAIESIQKRHKKQKKVE